jgi:DNA-binding CsgD family transcriptional regulator
MLAADGDRFLDAARLLAATAMERERLGYVRFLVEQREIDLAKSKIEAALGANGLAAALSEGANLSIDEAVSYARRGRGRRGRPSFGWASLTPTERRVVTLVVDGLTNAEIGGQMFVSSTTTKSHLTHIFAKLGVSSRRQLASAAKAVIV